MNLINSAHDKHREGFEVSGKLQQMYPTYRYTSILLFFCGLIHVQLFGTPWTVARQAPLPIGFFRQEYWSGLPFPTLGDLPEPGIKPKSPASPALAGAFLTTALPGKPIYL